MCRSLFVCPFPQGGGPGGAESRGGDSVGMFTGVEGDQRRGRNSGVGERVDGMGNGWRWRRGSVQVAGGPGGEAPWLARGPPKAGLAASINQWRAIHGCCECGASLKFQKFRVFS